MTFVDWIVVAGRCLAIASALYFVRMVIQRVRAGAWRTWPMLWLALITIGGVAFQWLPLEVRNLAMGFFVVLSMLYVVADARESMKQHQHMIDAYDDLLESIGRVQRQQVSKESEAIHE